MSDEHSALKGSRKSLPLMNVKLKISLLPVLLITHFFLLFKLINPYLKSNIKYPKSVICSLLLVSCLLFITPSAHAAAKNSITVQPQLTKLDLTKDKPEAEIFYTNASDATVELSLSLQDVRELEDRNPVGILDPKDAANYKYSLSSWAYLDRQNLTLNPGETQKIVVTITKDKLSPGGHYGSVLAEIHQAPTPGKSVQVQGVLASLLFVRASTGNSIEEAKIASFGVEDKGISFPDAFFFRLQNTGNVDLTPYGLLVIMDKNDKIVAKGIVNEDSLITLPEAIRKYSIPIKSLQKIILPGQYKAVLSLHFGKSNKQISTTTTFITGGTIPWLKWLVFVGVLIAVLVTVLMLWKRRKT